LPPRPWLPCWMFTSVFHPRSANCRACWSNVRVGQPASLAGLRRPHRATRFFRRTQVGQATVTCQHAVRLGGPRCPPCCRRRTCRNALDGRAPHRRRVGSSGWWCPRCFILRVRTVPKRVRPQQPQTQVHAQFHRRHPHPPAVPPPRPRACPGSPANSDQNCAGASHVERAAHQDQRAPAGRPPEIEAARLAGRGDTHVKGRSSLLFGFTREPW